MTVGEPINVLLIENSPDEAHAARQLLAQVNRGRFVVKCANDLPAALSDLARGGIDVILLDLSLPENQGWKALASMNTMMPEVPIIALASHNDESLAIGALREGAQDYLMKGEVDGRVLLRVMRHAIERKRAEKQVYEQMRQVAILQEVGRAVSSSLAVQEVLAVLLEKIDLLLPYSSVNIRLFNEASRRLEPVASRNLPIEQWTEYVKLTRGGLARKVFESRSPLVVQNVLKDPRVEDSDFFRRLGLVSYMGVPLVIKGNTFGVLSVVTKHEHEFSRNELRFLSALADQAAVAIYHSQLYEKTERQSRQLKMELEERKLVQGALQALNEGFRNIVQRSADGIMVVDQDGVVHFCNPAAESMFGLERDKILGSPFGFPVMAGETTEVDIVRSDGKVGIAGMRLVETEWEGKKACLVSLRDVTERKGLEKMKDRFFSTVSHDLRTPLNAVKGYLDLLLDGAYGELSGELAEVIQSVAQANKSMIDLVNALLDLGKMQSGRYVLSIESLEVQEVVDEVLKEARFLAEAKGLTLSKEIGRGSFFMKSDRRSIKQIVSNLVGNGIKFTDHGGIKVSVSFVAGHSGSGRDQVKIRIEDSGCGIGPHHLEKVFDEFYQVEENGNDTAIGTGLGLAICKRLVELLKGEVVVESEVGKGTAFTVVLPQTIEN